MYKITSIQDVSRPRCKRYVAHVDIASGIETKDEIKTIITQATDEIRNVHKPTHVVRLYVHFDSKLICQSMWADKTFTDAPLPKPLNYNDSIGDIGIVW